MLREGAPLRHSTWKPPSASISEKSATVRLSATMWPLPMIPPQRQPATIRRRPLRRANAILFIIVLLPMRGAPGSVWIQEFSAGALFRDFEPHRLGRLGVHEEFHPIIARRPAAVRLCKGEQ